MISTLYKTSANWQVETHDADSEIGYFVHYIVVYIAFHSFTIQAMQRLLNFSVNYGYDTIRNEIVVYHPIVKQVLWHVQEVR